MELLKLNIQYSNEYNQPIKAKFGNLTELVTDELIELCKNANYIVIYGHTKSGKSLLTKCISEKLENRKYIFSDWYKHLGFKQNMYAILRLILNNSNNEKMIIEGIQMSRLLRKGVQLNNFYPDIVIHIVCNYETIKYAYIKDGERHKLRNNLVLYWNNMIDKIFLDWYNLIKFSDKKPKIIKIDTSIL